jgi:amino acid adenylation domain-containing protein
VGICGEPVFGLISSLLGAMRAGAVLLPIDPRLPTARQQWMLEQAGAQVLAVVGDVDCDVDALAANRIRLSIDGTSGAVTTSADPRRAGQAPKAARRLPDDAAYLFFTSGTTGTPKGVIGSHRGLAHFIHWQREQFGIGPADRVAQVTGLSFDVVLRELFLPLTSGAALCLPEQPVDDPRALWPWLDRQGITVLHGVPSRLRGWLSHVPAGASPRSLRWLFMAGEPLSHTLVEAWRAVFPGEVINLYGPTETTLAKSWYAIPAGAALEPGIQPIGRPLPQTQLLVLGENDRLCGVGEPGEIVIRTPFASLGYLDAEQTRARFVPNPFRDDIPLPCF